VNVYSHINFDIEHIENLSVLMAWSADIWTGTCTLNTKRRAVFRNTEKKMCTHVIQIQVSVAIGDEFYISGRIRCQWSFPWWRLVIKTKTSMQKMEQITLFRQY